MTAPGRDLSVELAVRPDKDARAPAPPGLPAAASPGVPLALLPFALLGRVTSDATGMALARLAIMAIGTVSTILIIRILKLVGFAAAVVGGLG